MSGPKFPPKLIVYPKNPGRTAKMFREGKRPTLIHFKDEWFEWNGAAYGGIENDTIEAEVRAYLESGGVLVQEKLDGEMVEKVIPFRPMRKDVSEVYAALKNHCHVPPSTMTPPCWLAGTPDEYAELDPRNLIACQNGLLDITTRKLYRATPKFFTYNALSLTYDPLAPAPTRFLRFLQEVTAERQPLIDLLQEMVGYFISNDTAHQKIGFFRGKPRSGKGTLLRILIALKGEQNVATPTIQNLAQQFGKQGLIGKSLAAISDMNTDNKGMLSEAGAILNGISGEDNQTIPRKFRTDWIGKLDTRFLLISNRLPNFGSNTDAMATRLLMIPFDVSFVGREDFELSDALLTELPGILLWSLDGLDRLKARGRFVEPEDSKIAKRNLLYQSNPVHGFVAECCKVEPGTGTDKDVLYEAFSQFCRQSGFNSTKVLPKFSQDLQDLFDVTVRRRTADDGKQPGVFVGIRLNDELLPAFFAVNRDLIELGFEAHEALKLDKRGWPMVREDGGHDFEA